MAKGPVSAIVDDIRQTVDTTTDDGQAVTQGFDRSHGKTFRGRGNKKDIRSGQSSGNGVGVQPA
jgi:hypothetical protein